MRPVFDEKDAAILAKREAEMLACEGPLRGHFVRFPNGTICRMSHIWRFTDSSDIDIQTSKGGSFYLGDNGYVDFSGGMNSAISFEHFARTEEIMMGQVWFFHHGEVQAHNGVTTEAKFPVWECDILPDFVLSF